MVGKTYIQRLAHAEMKLRRLGKGNERPATGISILQLCILCLGRCGSPVTLLRRLTVAIRQKIGCGLILQQFNCKGQAGGKLEEPKDLGGAWGPHEGDMRERCRRSFQRCISSATRLSREYSSSHLQKGLSPAWRP